VPITATDLIYPPPGELRPEWFPGEDLTAAVAVWLTTGYASVAAVADVAEADRLAALYVYAQGFRNVACRLAGVPATASIDELSRGYNSKQYEFWLSEAERYQQEFDAGLAVALAPVVTAPASVPVASGSRPFVVAL